MAMPEELGAFAVPRSRVDRTHVTMREAILRALDPVLLLSARSGRTGQSGFRGAVCRGREPI